MANTTRERQNQVQLGQDRSITNQNEEEKIKSESDSEESGSNVITLIIFLPLALAADTLGILDLTGFGAIIVRTVNFPVLATLWLWRILKTGPKKDPTLQLITGFLIEQSPVGIVPTWTIMVLYFYFQDTKLGKKTIGKAQKLKQAKI